RERREPSRETPCVVCRVCAGRRTPHRGRRVCGAWIPRRNFRGSRRAGHAARRLSAARRCAGAAMSRRLLRYLDWPVLAATCILVAGGAVVLYSAVQNSGDAGALVRPRVLHAIFRPVVIALVVRQPDLGTSMVLTAIVAVMLFAGGAPLRAMGAMGAGAAAVAPMAWRILHDYQRRRLLVFIDPGADPLGAGYALIQSKIAVGSGQVFGKGLLHGTQNLLHFIPEQHTDFVFTVIG